MSCLKKISIFLVLSFFISLFIEVALFQKAFNYLFLNQSDFIKEYTISSDNFNNLSQSRKINFDKSPFISFDLNSYGYVRGIKVQISGASYSDCIRVYFSDGANSFSDSSFVRHKIKKNKKFDYIVLNKYAKRIGFGSESIARDKNIISVTVNPSIKETIKYVSWGNVLQLTLLSFLSLLFLFQRVIIISSSECIRNLFEKTNCHKIFNSYFYNAILFIVLYCYFFYYASIFASNITFDYPEKFYPIIYKLLVLLAVIRLLYIYLQKKLYFLLLSCFIVYSFNQIYLINNIFRYLLEFSLLVVACYKVPYKTILVCYLSSVGVLFVSSFLLTSFGALKNTVYFNGEFFRNSLGGIYPTDWAAYLFYLCTVTYSLIKRRLDFVLCLFLIVFIYIQYKYTKTRNTEMLMAISILMIMWFILRLPHMVNNMLFLDKIFLIFSYCSFALWACIAILLGYFYSPDDYYMSILNDLFSSRLQLVRDAFTNYDIAFLGNYMEMIGNSEIPRIGYNYLDSTYCQLLIRYGVISLVIFCTLYCLTIRNSIQQKNYKIVPCMALIALHSFTEPHYIEFFMNPFILLVFSDLSLKKEYELHV